MQGGPLEHVIGGKAQAFCEALRPEFKSYQKQVIKNNQALARQLQERGLRIVSGGTDNHLTLVDVKKSHRLTGKDVEKLLDEIGITCNKNSIPFDDESPFKTSGIRVGTPAMTTRGLLETDFIEVANIIVDTIEQKFDKIELKDRVLRITKKYPLYN